MKALVLESSSEVLMEFRDDMSEEGEEKISEIFPDSIQEDLNTLYIFKCVICCDEFQTKNEIDEHIAKKHVFYKRIHYSKCAWVFKCGNCKYESSSKPKMIQHIEEKHTLIIIQEDEKLEKDSLNNPKVVHEGVFCPIFIGISQVLFKFQSPQ